MNGNWKGKEVALNYKQKNTVELQKEKRERNNKKDERAGDKENKANNGEIRWKKIWIE